MQRIARNVKTTAPAGPELRLVAISFAGVDFDATLADGTTRPVRVLVGSGSTWRRAVVFPCCSSAATETLGDERLDELVRGRAAEELARLDCILREARGVAA